MAVDRLLIKNIGLHTAAERICTERAIRASALARSARYLCYLSRAAAVNSIGLLLQKLSIHAEDLSAHREITYLCMYIYIL